MPEEEEEAALRRLVAAPELREATRRRRLRRRRSAAVERRGEITAEHARSSNTAKQRHSISETHLRFLPRRRCSTAAAAGAAPEFHRARLHPRV